MKPFYRPLDPRLPRRMAQTLRPRIHIMNGGAQHKGVSSHGDKFHVNGSHFYFNKHKNRFVRWA